MALSDYKQLIAWQRAMSLCKQIYRISSHFPGDERFGLTNQIRRAAVSVASNIAEGQGRGTTRDFLHFLDIANGSRQEVETQLLLAIELEFVTPEQTAGGLDLIAELGRVLSGLRASLS